MPKWMDTAAVLGQFNADLKAARNAYRSFVSEGLEMGRNPTLTGGGLVRSKGGWSQVVSARRNEVKEEFDERILGNGDFVNGILREAEGKIKRQLKLRQAGLTLSKIIVEECREGRISATELQGGSRRKRVSVVRAKVARRGLDELGVTMAEIARQVGVNTSSIARAIDRTKVMKKG